MIPSLDLLLFYLKLSLVLSTSLDYFSIGWHLSL